MPKFYDIDVVESHFDGLELIEHIDSGGFKDVFLVNDRGEEVVLKLLPVDRRSRRRRAHREGEAMKEIESNTFVDLIDYYEEEIDGRQTFIIFEEYINGQTLEQYIGDGNFGLDFGLYTISTLLDILKEFDEKEMIHRDIKPANIMVTDDEEIRLLDVGIMRFEEKESLTPDHLDRLGTPFYGAPEQLDYDKSKQSIKTDLFSSGVVMFETITGVHPFKDRGKSVTDAICDGDKQSLTDYIDGDEGEDLDYFFDTLTNPVPSKRFRKPEFAEDFFDSLEVTN
ncbi:serine/threonine protein kinase [Halorarum halobium]|uniref:serine/threonine protein kinase n=1 Tax=Halorarum halobium TaxID=3075121 RepID=UPI0028AA3842|nr:protein kinase [Halobaculum sp. XH14]